MCQGEVPILKSWCSRRSSRVVDLRESFLRGGGMRRPVRRRKLRRWPRGHKTNPQLARRTIGRTDGLSSLRTVWNTREVEGSRTDVWGSTRTRAGQENF
ncbi:hypothetical protein RRG08_019515 [Elysia crispata]|uniref:Uncharacterized protein n=1 Tax=Elysia crispata TaxID=231223 RepID=A0AAE1DX71_9GAST|nr:hypothetical protein RRG08_019515 [Elysia crispata]